MMNEVREAKATWGHFKENLGSLALSEIDTAGEFQAGKLF